MQEALELINIGKSFLKKEDYDSAIVNFDLAKKLDPKESEVYHCLALAYLKKDDLDLAIKNYKKVLEFNPKEDKILNCLGDLYTKKKKFKEALTYLNKSMAMNPNNVLTHYYMGNYRLKTGDYDCAIESYKKARSLGSKSAKLYYGLGLAYKYKGKFDYSKIRLFLIFLLWKASISNEPYWENVSLGKYESKALEVLKGINCHDKYFGFMIMKNQIPLFNNSHINPYPVKYYNVLTHSFFFAGYIIEIIPNFKRFMNGVECDGNRIRRIIAEDNKDLIIMIEKSPNMNGLVDAQNIINKHLSLQRNL